MPDDWTVDGTVGYEYLNLLNGLFVEPRAAEEIAASHREFTGDREPFREVLYQSKSLILRRSLASELNTLARQLNRVSEADRRSRDFTHTDLREAIRETIAWFPVYRTYLQPDQPVSDQDRGYIEQAVAQARRRNPQFDGSWFDFVRNVLLLNVRDGASANERSLVEQFVKRFQQTTGPVQAKGLEDTAFYRRVQLASLNEVGADPHRFAVTPREFHEFNSHILARWPGTFLATATHDTKRGEDARIRINALSEMPDAWRAHLNRWAGLNASQKVRVNGVLCPDPQEEYLFYQALLGAWRLGDNEGDAPAGLAERMRQYVMKAAREAKVNTSWTDPDSSYVEALAQFVTNVLEGEDSRAFLDAFRPFQRKLARIGVVHSLSQTVLKLASPGIPDFFQGCELWDFRLVDPDNRTPVDYLNRANMLSRICSCLQEGECRSTLAQSLFEQPADGAIKLYTIMTLLKHRGQHVDLYQHGQYRPLTAGGSRRENVIAFAREGGSTAAIAVASRLVSELMGENAGRMPTGQRRLG